MRTCHFIIWVFFANFCTRCISILNILTMPNRFETSDFSISQGTRRYEKIRTGCVAFLLAGTTPGLTSNQIRRESNEL